MGEWRYSSIIFDLDTRWKWVVSFTPRPLYLRWRSPRNAFDRRLGGLQKRSGRCGIEENIVSAGNRTPAAQPVARRFTDWVIPAHFKPMYAMLNSVFCVAQGKYTHRKVIEEKSKLKREAVCSFEMWVKFYQTTRHHVPEDRILQNYQCENLKPNSYYNKSHCPTFRAVYCIWKCSQLFWP
jgi:hypothetical protein